MPIRRVAPVVPKWRQVFSPSGLVLARLLKQIEQVRPVPRLGKGNGSLLQLAVVQEALPPGGLLR